MVSRISFLIRSLLNFVPAGTVADRGDSKIKLYFWPVQSHCAQQKPCLYCYEEAIQSFILQIIHEKLQQCFHTHKMPDASRGSNNIMVLHLYRTSQVCFIASCAHHTDGECTSVEWHTLTDLIHSGRITEMVWGIQVCPETFCPAAATTVLLFVLNEMFVCLGIVWCLNKDEMNNRDVPPIPGAKAPSSTKAHNRLPWSTGYLLDHSEF